jgi:hypothetical protein
VLTLIFRQPYTLKWLHNDFRYRTVLRFALRVRCSAFNLCLHSTVILGATPAGADYLRQHMCVVQYHVAGRGLCSLIVITRLGVQTLIVITRSGVQTIVVITRLGVQTIVVITTNTATLKLRCQYWQLESKLPFRRMRHRLHRQNVRSIMRVTRLCRRLRRRRVRSVLQRRWLF